MPIKNGEKIFLTPATGRGEAPPKLDRRGGRPTPWILNLHLQVDPAWAGVFLIWDWLG